MPDELVVVILSAIGNGLVTWGVISTKLAWHKSLIDDQGERLRDLEKHRCTPS